MMSLDSFNPNQFKAEMNEALRREMEKKPLNGPMYDSSHIVIAMKLGEKQAEERIIKLLEAKDENLIGEISDWFEYGLEHQAGRAARSRVIALIKGEK